MQALSNKRQVSDERPLARVGQINFVNVLPVVLPLTRQRLAFEAEVRFDTPTELNRQFAQGLLDAGAMSSYFYLTRSDLTLIEGPSISSIGAVGSVLFFSKVAAEKLDGKRVAVPKASATSINLVKVLLKELYDAEIETVACKRPDIEDESFEAALVMGDHALTVDSEWSKSYKRRDMGQWWHETYNLPMVFGVWAARSDWVKAQPRQFEVISSSLKEASRLGLTEMFADVVEETEKRLAGLSRERIINYFKNQLNFDYTDEHQRGLDKYRSLCEKHGLLEKLKENAGRSAI